MKKDVSIIKRFIALIVLFPVVLILGTLFILAPLCTVISASLCIAKQSLMLPANWLLLRSLVGTAFTIIVGLYAIPTLIVENTKISWSMLLPAILVTFTITLIAAGAAFIAMVNCQYQIGNIILIILGLMALAYVAISIALWLLWY